MAIKPKVKYIPKDPGTGEYWTVEVTQRIYDGADCYPWTKTFVMWPRRSITGQPLFWEWAYKRRVWLVWGTGFHMEPEVEYASILEIMCNPEL